MKKNPFTLNLENLFLSLPDDLLKLIPQYLKNRKDITRWRISSKALEHKTREIWLDFLKEEKQELEDIFLKLHPDHKLSDKEELIRRGKFSVEAKLWEIDDSIKMKRNYISTSSDSLKQDALFLIKLYEFEYARGDKGSGIKLASIYIDSIHIYLSIEHCIVVGLDGEKAEQILQAFASDELYKGAYDLLSYRFGLNSSVGFEPRTFNM